MSSFQLYPAIDLLDGACVRLYKGNYNESTVYEANPLKQVERFVAAGTQALHIVDLNGAKEGIPVHANLIQTMIANHDLFVQVGGGIRNEATLATYIEAGVKRIILGSIAVKNPAFVKEMLKKYEGFIALGVDARDGFVAIQGWEETTEKRAVDFVNYWRDYGVTDVIYTDISRDGTLQGSNLAETKSLAKQTGAHVIASGGVASLEELEILTGYYKNGVQGAIIGKALYQGRFTLIDALQRVEVSC